ncbi:uncharacterized protein CXorf51A-like [Diceros bicornis minor]|uniref:uncharacterized protein CXorf51A-like n=1 Tax=Diceros bicornis minor TaxID=77932 RepID=UPI0026F0D8EC|nr:uncharacterized protein CXorf51A-like [Diceros bicornis minor]
MARVTRTPQASSTVMEQPRQRTPNTKERKKSKASCQPRSRGSVKVAKKTMGAKRSLKRSLRKKASPKNPTSSTKSKKARGTALFGHYHRLNEELSQNEPESVEEPTTSHDYLGSQ